MTKLLCICLVMVVILASGLSAERKRPVGSMKDVLPSSVSASLHVIAPSEPTSELPGFVLYIHNRSKRSIDIPRSWIRREYNNLQFSHNDVDVRYIPPYTPPVGGKTLAIKIQPGTDIGLVMSAPTHSEFYSIYYNEQGTYTARWTVYPDAEVTFVKGKDGKITYPELTGDRSELLQRILEEVRQTSFDRQSAFTFTIHPSPELKRLIVEYTGEQRAEHIMELEKSLKLTRTPVDAASFVHVLSFFKSADAIRALQKFRLRLLDDETIMGASQDGLLKEIDAIIHDAKPQHEPKNP